MFHDLISEDNPEAASFLDREFGAMDEGGQHGTEPRDSRPATGQYDSTGRFTPSAPMEEPSKRKVTPLISAEELAAAPPSMRPFLRGGAGDVAGKSAGVQTDKDRLVSDIMYDKSGPRWKSLWPKETPARIAEPAARTFPNDISPGFQASGQLKDGMRHTDTLLPSGEISREIQTPGGQAARSVLPEGSLSPVTQFLAEKPRDVGVLGAKGLEGTAGEGPDPEQQQQPKGKSEFAKAVEGIKQREEDRGAEIPGVPEGDRLAPVPIARPPQQPVYGELPNESVLAPPPIRPGSNAALPYKRARPDTKTFRPVPAMFVPGKQDPRSSMPLSDSEAGAAQLHEYMTQQPGRAVRVGNDLFRQGKTAGETATNFRNIMRGASESDRTRGYALGSILFKKR